MRKKPEQTEMTRNSFQDAFWTLYEKQGIEKTTVKDVCSVAGYNRSTFYQYYTDVYDLLHKAEDQFLADIRKSVVALVEEAQNFDWSSMLQAVFGLLEQNNRYISILFGPHGNTAFIHRLVENLKPIWVKYFFQAAQYTPAEIDLLMEHNIMGLLSMFRKWFFDHNSVSDERFIQLSYLTLPDTSCFGNLDIELRR
jgi:AcrR family transcriptional regulator